VPTVPALAKVNRSTIPFLDENRSLSACTNKVLLPFAKEPIPDPDFPEHSGIPYYKTAGPSFVGLAGESRLTDADTPFYHFQNTAGPTGVQFRDPNGNSFIAQTATPPAGVRPIMPDQRPPDRPNVPCETQEPPDMNAPGGPPDRTFVPSGPCSPSDDPLACIPLPRREKAEEQWNALKSYFERVKDGLPALDPLPYTPSTFKSILGEGGLKLDAAGKQVPDPKAKNAPKR